MRLKQEHRLLNFIFNHESDIKNAIDVPDVLIGGYVIFSPRRWLEIILRTYEYARKKNADVYELAVRRFRQKEFYVKTFLLMHISPAKYYRLLNIFFKIAEKMRIESFGVVIQ